MGQVDRLSVTMPHEIGTAVRLAAAQQGTSVSSWLSEAAEQRLRHAFLGEALAAFEAESGAFTPAELEHARRALRGPARRRSA